SIYRHHAEGIGKNPRTFITSIIKVLVTKNVAVQYRERERVDSVGKERNPLWNLNKFLKLS
ncbi:unnamed protein product, partial [Larinioides sclopetarius]